MYSAMSSMNEALSSLKEAVEFWRNDGKISTKAKHLTDLFTRKISDAELQLEQTKKLAVQNLSKRTYSNVSNKFWLGKCPHPIATLYFKACNITNLFCEN